jgi:hypothetical protein
LPGVSTLCEAPGLRRVHRRFWGRPIADFTAKAQRGHAFFFASWRLCVEPGEIYQGNDCQRNGIEALLYKNIPLTFIPLASGFRLRSRGRRISRLSFCAKLVLRFQIADFKLQSGPARETELESSILVLGQRLKEKEQGNRCLKTGG